MRYCPDCGSKIGEDANFCPDCGANISGKPKDSETYDHPAKSKNGKATEERVKSRNYPEVIASYGFLIGLLLMFVSMFLSWFGPITEVMGGLNLFDFAKWGKNTLVPLEGGYWLGVILIITGLISFLLGSIIALKKTKGQIPFLVKDYSTRKKLSYIFNLGGYLSILGWGYIGIEAGYQGFLESVSEFFGFGATLFLIGILIVTISYEKLGYGSLF